MSEQNKGTPKEPGKGFSGIAFNPSWFRRQLLIPRKTQLHIQIIPWSPHEALFSFFETTWMKRKGYTQKVICNCRCGQLPVPCVPCHLATGRYRRMELFPTRRWAVTVLLLHVFHKVKDRYTKHFLCKGEGCSRCAQGVETTFGLRKYLSLEETSRAKFEDEVEGDFDSTYVVSTAGIKRTPAGTKVGGVAPVYARSPFPFSMFLMCMGLDEQANLLGEKNPFPPQAQSQLDKMYVDLLISANSVFVEKY